MSRAIRRSDYRVEVVPRDLGDLGWTSIGGMVRSDKEMIAACEAIADQIRRHVDGLPSYRRKGVMVRWDETPVCSHCGSKWSEESHDYNGGCCDKDETANPNPPV